MRRQEEYSQTHPLKRILLTREVQSNCQVETMSKIGERRG
jgi:hypothetical protein